MSRRRCICCTRKNVHRLLVVFTIVVLVLTSRYLQNLIKLIDFLNEGDTLYTNPDDHIKDIYLKLIEKPDVIQLHKRDGYQEEPEIAMTSDPTWPSLRGTSITMAEIKGKFKRCRETSIKQNKECGRVHEDPLAFWRSNGTVRKSKDEDFRRISLASDCCAFEHENLMRLPPRESLFYWEEDYLSQPHLSDLMDTADASKSTIHIISEPANGVFTVGDKVEFLVTLYDGNGNKRELGGDSVNLWLYNDDLGAYIAADVTDFQDGSYSATTLLPWSGVVKVNATIAYSRELYRAVLFVQRLFKTTHWFTATFATPEASETTPCLTHPELPGFTKTEVCNLTQENGGFPWYCGKPVKSQLLNCSNYATVRRLDMNSMFPLTRAEELLMRYTETRRPFLIPNDIILKVVSKSTHLSLPLPKLQCKDRRLPDTFDDTNVSGYFFNNTWRPFACRLPEINKQFMLDCLRNTSVLYLGDSNSRSQNDLLRALIQCQDRKRRYKLTWHAMLLCDNFTMGVSLAYYPAKHPFYGSFQEDLSIDVIYSSVEKLDSIPAEGKYIVHLHDFLHLVPFHLSVLEHRLGLVRLAVQRLLARNPTAYIIYQSAHSAYAGWRGIRHKMDYYLLDLQRNAMKGLGERVMFAYTWPMTVAVKNMETHPEISHQFLNLYMGHICGR
ncbi:NXPE family member 3-like isoform X2 [Physella acuta]|uniref:NXPE family member 3-like isoform X2 n=1 Tax=Physella acuta TaxID=109671 RepID=UPI0027DE111D|nr:NXPE family member 3-like isoform X2 [Physella acuta]